jgi:hypothetical protein
MLTRKFNLVEFAQELGRLAGEWIAARKPRTGNSAINEPIGAAIQSSQVGSQQEDAVDPNQPACSMLDNHR